MRYPVVLTRDDNDTYVVTFPDVPEAITYGETREEALQRAPDALLTIFDAFIKDRRDIPMPNAMTGPVVEVPPLECTKIELYRAMRASKVGKAELARRLDWHLPQVDRVLNIRHGSRLDQLDAALRVLGKRLSIAVTDAEMPTREDARRTADHARAAKRLTHVIRRRGAAGSRGRTAVGVVAHRNRPMRKVRAKKR